VSPPPRPVSHQLVRWWCAYVLTGVWWVVAVVCRYAAAAAVGTLSILGGSSTRFLVECATLLLALAWMGSWLHGAYLGFQVFKSSGSTESGKHK